MKQLLYIGNNLRQKTTNNSFMATLVPLLETEGYSLFYASSKRNKLLRLMDMLYHVFHYRKKVNLVIIDTYSTQNFYYALLISQLCRILKKSYITNLHGGDLPLRLMKSPTLSNAIFKNSKYNVAPSTYLKESFESFGYKNLIYIPNTIAINTYPFFNRTYDTPKLLWVRSFAKMYNPLLAIRVLKFLNESGIDATLCMVGPDNDGSLRDVKELADQLQVRVNFTGKLTKQQWVKLSADYNVFINTTNIDNTPVSVIEAMALGLPIVSTNVGGIPYLIQHDFHGVLVEKDNVEAMSNAIMSLFKEPEKRDKMITNARKRAETFDWNKVKIAWNEILQN